MYSSKLLVFFLRSTFINVTPSIWELPVDAGPGWGGQGGGACKCLFCGWVRANFVWSLLSQREKDCQDVLWGKVPRKTWRGRGDKSFLGNTQIDVATLIKVLLFACFFLLFVSTLIIHVRDENSNQTRSHSVLDEKPNHLPGPAGHTEMRKSN